MDGLHYPVVALAACKVNVAGPVVGELGKLSRADWLHIFHNTPSDSFRARRSREGARVAPEITEVDAVEETGQSVLLAIGGVGVTARGQSLENALDEGVLLAASVLNVEEDADDSKSVVRAQVDEMDLQVVELAIDSVLGGGVEVELSRGESFGLTSSEDQFEHGVFVLRSREVHLLAEIGGKWIGVGAIEVEVVVPD